ncbi:hypothetical protein BFW01_g1777 [Lasiodiplodia theobromae]|uniref:Uncharacterized protein n=1 Tax=Lasiodiplodia theobromae TaxID=45133 RepID=A0A8H7ME93_9PEZI|nr:hypothetical protein BFW01_g1777 [Lasiodiplodia theobromae]
MKFLDSAIAAIALGLCVSSSAATPVSGDFAVNDIAKRDCIADAAIIKKWKEDALQRYRVAFSTTDSSIVYKLGEVCDKFDDHIAKCGGINNNIQCYFSTPYSSWLIDNNQLIGAGDPIEDCLVEAFREKLANHFGCHIG